MKLYGSLNNRLMENSAPIVPIVGMGATILLYTDRIACTITEVKTPKKIVIHHDNVKRTDDNGMSDCQSYSYETQTLSAGEEVTLRKDGRWKISKSNTVVMIGHRDHHYDYSF